MYSYLMLKHAHMGFAYLSILLFAARGGLMLGNKQHILALKPLRILPHVIDTLLLGCAIALIFMANWPVMQSPWLLAKIGGLIAYIVLGSIALKYGKTKPIRIAAFGAALAVVMYIVLVAKTKLAIPF